MLYPALEFEHEIRLINIIPEKNVPIRITLFKASLNDIPERRKYSALSYVWGPPDPRKSITCNGTELTVTANLEAALVQLRDDAKETVMWIDQICINQEDNDERNRQVSMMGRIYSMAERVIVWLGPSDHDTARLWCLLLELGRLRDFGNHEVYDLALKNQSNDFPRLGSGVDVNAKVLDMSSDKTRKQLPDLPPLKDPLWQAVKRYFDRPWFHRIWTFQEVLMSRKCAVWCGEFFMSWRILQNACQAMDIAGYVTYVEITQNVTYIYDQQERLLKGETTSLRYLLEINRPRKAAEPRDMVYALRGVLDQEAANLVTIEYGASLGLVYARATRLCIETDHALTILGSVEYRRTAESKSQMPSWVPDWRFRGSVNVDLSMRRADESKYFNASKNFHPYLMATKNERKLCLRGFVVATLTRFSNVKSHLCFEHHMGARRFPTERFEAENWRKLYEAAVSQLPFPASDIKKPGQADHIMACTWSKSIDQPLTDEQTLEMAYRRTITADLYPRPNSRLTERETTLSFPAYTSWKNSGYPDPVPVDVLHEHDYYVSQVMTNREFFIAEDASTSYMGITMGVPRDGDCVCILLGGDTPFVLRPLGDGYWCFLADAYVHGIMDGEAMDMRAAQDLQYHDFTLV